MNELIIFSIAILFIFAKAFQQRNVIHNNWWWIPVFSFTMSFLELGALSLGIMDIANNGWHRLISLGIAQGAGGTIGCWLAMYTHNRLHKL